MSYESISLVEMDDFLRQRRFKPVDLYFRRRPVKEWVYERRLPQNANHFVRVYTTIQRYGGKADQSRDVGKDAIRVQVIYRDEKGETLVSMPKRVNRVSTWRDNLDDRLKELAESLPKVKMDSRGEPMTLRKKRGNLFWGSRDYPNYKETQRYGAESTNWKDRVVRLLKGYDTKVAGKLRIEDPNWGNINVVWQQDQGLVFDPEYRQRWDHWWGDEEDKNEEESWDDLYQWPLEQEIRQLLVQNGVDDAQVSVGEKGRVYVRQEVQFAAEDINQTPNNTIINILLLEWAMKTNDTYDSLTIQKGLADYIEESPYDFLGHMLDQDLISLATDIDLPIVDHPRWRGEPRALVPTTFLKYLQDKDRDHWVNMKSRAISKERYQMIKEKISEDRFWLSDNHKANEANYYQGLARSAINYQNI